MDKIVKKSQAPFKQHKVTSFTNQLTNRSTNSTAISQSAGNKTPVVSQPTQKYPLGSSTGPVSNTRSQSKQGISDNKKEAWADWAKGTVSKLAQTFSGDTPLTAKGKSSDKPQQFKSGDCVVLHSVVNDIAIYGTVRWAGDVTVHGQSMPFVGIETVSSLYVLISFNIP